MYKRQGYAVVKTGLLKSSDSKVLSVVFVYLVMPCVCLLYTSISGSASAAAAAVGSMIRDGADEQGYDPAVTAATNAASSCSGLLIPPSNALITYSLASGGTSVAALFMAGYIPGIIWAPVSYTHLPPKHPARCASRSGNPLQRSRAPRR